MNFVELPPDTQLAVAAFVAVAVDLLVTALISYAPWLGWLADYKEEWAKVAAAFVLGLLQNALPGGEWTQVSILAVQLILAVLAVVTMAKKFLAKRGARKLL